MKRCPSCATSNEDLALSCVSCGNAFGTVLPSYSGGGAGGADVTTLSADPDLVGGRYRLLEQLGKGGAGVVYRAFDTKLEEDIAIKILQQDANADGAEIGRFKREITTARKITHPNVIRIHDFGESGRDVFISMEILTGGTLGRRMKEGISMADALAVAVEVCQGVQAAHALGIVHRDLKPDNILFDADGRPKVVDFGLARLAMASTRTVGFSGTPFYMSPEHANGSEVTTRSDVYSLGIVFYQLFTGRLPFTAENFLRLVTMHCNEAPPPMRSIAPSVPPELERVILRALEKNPAKRHANAGELQADLKRISLPVGADETVSRSIPDLSQSLRMPGPVPMPVHELSPKRASRLPLFAIAGGGAALLLAGISAAVMFGGSSPTPIVAAPSPTPTAIAVVTLEETPVPATPVPAATPAAVKTPVPAPTKRATPVPVRTAAPAPTATKVAVAAKGSVKVTAHSLVEVFIDGAKVGAAPYEQDLKPGSHLVRLVAPGPPAKTKSYTVNVVAGKRVELFYDADKNEITQKR